MHLFLHVKVREGWGDDPERYREMGLEFPEGVIVDSGAECSEEHGIR